MQGSSNSQEPAEIAWECLRITREEAQGLSPGVLRRSASRRCRGAHRTRPRKEEESRGATVQKRERALSALRTGGGPRLRPRGVRGGAAGTPDSTVRSLGERLQSAHPFELQCSLWRNNSYLRVVRT